MSVNLRCDFKVLKIEFNSPRSPFIGVVVISKLFSNFFHCHNSKDRPTVDGKNSANAQLNF